MSSAANAIAQAPRAPYYAVIFTLSEQRGIKAMGIWRIEWPSWRGSSPDFLAWKACGVQMALASQFPIASRKTPYNARKHIRNTSLHNKLAKEFGTQTIFSESRRSNELTAKL